MCSLKISVEILILPDVCDPLSYRVVGTELLYILEEVAHLVLETSYSGLTGWRGIQVLGVSPSVVKTEVEPSWMRRKTSLRINKEV